MLEKYWFWKFFSFYFFLFSKYPRPLILEKYLIFLQKFTFIDPYFVFQIIHVCWSIFSVDPVKIFSIFFFKKSSSVGPKKIFTNFSKNPLLLILENIYNFHFMSVDPGKIISIFFFQMPTSVFPQKVLLFFFKFTYVYPQNNFIFFNSRLLILEKYFLFFFKNSTSVDPGKIFSFFFKLHVFWSWKIFLYFFQIIHDCWSWENIFNCFFIHVSWSWKNIFNFFSKNSRLLILKNYFQKFSTSAFFKFSSAGEYFNFFFQKTASVHSEKKKKIFSFFLNRHLLILKNYFQLESKSFKTLSFKSIPVNSDCWFLQIFL